LFKGYKLQKSGDSTISFNKDFRRALIALVIPIAMQNLISATVQSAVLEAAEAFL